MTEHLTKQQQLQRSISRSLENFKKLGRGNLTLGRVKSRINALKDSWTQFQEGHCALLKVIPVANQEAFDYFKENHFDATEDAYLTTLDYMTECQVELEPSVSANNTSVLDVAPSTSAFPLSHLPPIELPPFDGNYEEWEHFRDRFTSLIINNRELSNFSRMHFLASCLTGRARDCIAHLPITTDSYQIAWKALTDRFECKRRLLNRHLATLLNLHSITRESATDLQLIRDKATTAVAALKTLNRSSADLWNDILVYMISSKLDPVTRKAWNVKSSDTAEPPSFDDLSKFLTSRTRALEEYRYEYQPDSSVSVKGRVKLPNHNRVTTVTATATSSHKCSLCSANHYLSSCPRFLSRSPSQRREITKQSNHCFNCLSRDHSAAECRSKHTCRLYQKRHHTLLHVVSASSSDTNTIASVTGVPPRSDERHQDVSSLIASTKLNVRYQILLATARVAVRSSSGRSVIVRALLDQGSQMSFITESLAQILYAKRLNMPTEVSAVGGVNAGLYRQAMRISVSHREHTTPAFSTVALILPTLTAYAPKRIRHDLALEHLIGLPWADPDPMSSDAIGLILGSDLYSELLLDGVRKGQPGQPIAQNTVLGWVLSGPLDNPVAQSCVASITQAGESESLSHPHRQLHSLHCLSSSTLDQDIRRFWESEEISREPLLAPQEEQCERHFVETHSRQSDGRYIVRLPFKEGPPIDIGESFTRANRVLKTIYRRFHNQLDQQKEYTEFLQDYEECGHMISVPDSTGIPDQCVYIPHHPVIRESSVTTHLRVVFNASSLTTNGSSLNDHLLIGPKLQTDLSAVLLRWRQHRYVYSADIKQMYRQIKVDSRDIDYQRILWNPSAVGAPRVYRLSTVTYSMACAPFLALRVLKQLAEDEGSKFPLAVPILRSNVYVDDVLFGADEIQTIQQTRNQVRDLLARGGFSLRKWASNSSELLFDLIADDHGLACNKVLQSDERLKILGLSWNPSSDTFQFVVSLQNHIPQTKRTILSSIAKLFFDPLGWVTPVVIQAKVFMQSLWRLTLKWDEPVPVETLRTWRSIYTNLSALNGLRLSRWIGLGSHVESTELHGFADASSVAYAAVVYLRVVSRSGDVQISLLAGKSRVAPVSTMSIPRLELSATVLLARLIRSLQNSLDLGSIPCICWTDSTVTLAWLKQFPSNWKTFVANRVAEVQSSLPGATWRHVPTNDNPADCASRGLAGNDLLACELWWHGPSWLRLPESRWPARMGFRSLETEDLPEKRVVVHLTEQRGFWDLSERFSSWTKLIRVTAYIMRFVSHCKTKKDSSQSSIRTVALSAREFHLAKLFWLKQLQRSSFSNEIQALTKCQSVHSKSPIVALHPFLDNDGLVRVGGRLKEAPIPFDQKHPIILASHALVKLIVAHVHLRMLHSGPRLTIATLRQEFWILHTRDVVKSVLHHCVRCARDRAAVPAQLMGNLPSVRVSPPPRCFINCGLDYAGPVHIRASAGRGIKSRKAYIALFVCLATKAIHLELVGSYSTQAFLDAFSRFCARRGLPRSVYSDNGTNFVGADRELSSAYRSAIRDPDLLNSTTTDSISWHFMPPSAPHFGGLWEAGVRSMKQHLRRVLGNHTLTFEEFTTLLCRVEACLNSRPLAPMTDSVDDFETLTPAHFLVGSSLTVPPEQSVLNVNENRLSRWQLVRHLTERFWRLWQSDYVNSLQQRVKWKPTIAIGRIVLLRNNTLPPCKWELGRVTLCHPGSDNLTRVVTVKTANSEYKRPITKLCLLPIDIEQISEEREPIT